MHDSQKINLIQFYYLKWELHDTTGEISTALGSTGE
jgi:hypothetical protein